MPAPALDHATPSHLQEAGAAQTAHEAAAHDRWFREQVQMALDEADKPDAEFIPHEQVMAEWEIQRAELLRRAREKAAS